MCENNLNNFLLKSLKIFPIYYLFFLRFPGFADRLKSELNLLAPAKYPMIIEPPNREYISWTGGSKLASLSAFQPMWMKKNV